MDMRAADIVQTAAQFSGAPGLEFPVRVKEIAQAADPATQTFQVRVAMKSPPGINLLPGMTATVSLSYRRARILEDRILVPISAVFKDATGEQVAWVVGPEQTVSRRPANTATQCLGYPDLPELELDIVDHRHAAPELSVFQADRWLGIWKQ